MLPSKSLTHTHGRERRWLLLQRSTTIVVSACFLVLGTIAGGHHSHDSPTARHHPPQVLYVQPPAHFFTPAPLDTLPSLHAMVPPADSIAVLASVEGPVPRSMATQQFGVSSLGTCCLHSLLATLRKQGHQLHIHL